MSRAIITHFDGDPFTINAWLTLYDKYWRGECDKVYITLYYNEKAIPDYIVAYDKMILSKYPEFDTTILSLHKPPELGNQKSLDKATEDYIGLIESDGLIYGSGIVDQCFRLLEKEGQDIVTPPWYLIDDPYINGDLNSKGFMRCFCFAKKSVWDRTDHDFFPRTIPADTPLSIKYKTAKPIDLDCFGWMSWQMLLQEPKITYTPNNILGPDNILSPYSNYKWVHIRQMSSSAMGLGGGESLIWSGKDNKEILQHVMHVFNVDFPAGPAEFTYIKAIAFKLLFWDMLKDKKELGNFANDYRQMLELAMDYYNIPKQVIYEIKGFYKGLMNV